MVVVKMGLVDRLEWLNSYGKKQCRSLFWKVRAAVKKAVKSGGAKHQLKFQYDPSSYALNFDDGCCHFGVGENLVKQTKIQDCSDSKSTIWVYVVWVEP